LSGYILAIDQSTTGTKAIVFRKGCELVGKATVSHEQYYPEPGWVEHDPNEILTCTYEACKEALEATKINPHAVQAIAITNQRETVIAWDKRTGTPLYRALVWQCQRGRDICEELKRSGYAPFVKERTGLVLDPYFSASKLAWLFRNIVTHHSGRHIAVGTVDSWLIWHFTQGSVHATDYSNASRTMLLNIGDLQWDEELLSLFSVPYEVLPQLLPSDAVFGYTDLRGILPQAVPIMGVMGDSSAALCGQLGYRVGDIKATYGTGTSIMVNTGSMRRVASSAVTSIGWFVGDKPTFVLEGNIHSSGDTIRWLVEELGLFSSYGEVECLATALVDNQGVYFVPAFVGLGAPYWNGEARALICGISKGATRAHIARAALESIGFQVFDLYSALQEESGLQFEFLRADGGATKNAFLMQWQADLLQVPVRVSEVEDGSAKGVALLAAEKLGIGKENIASVPATTYVPRMEKIRRDQYVAEWHRAVKRSML